MVGSSPMNSPIPVHVYECMYVHTYAHTCIHMYKHMYTDWAQNVKAISDFTIFIKQKFLVGLYAFILLSQIQNESKGD